MNKQPAIIERIMIVLSPPGLCGRCHPAITTKD